MSTKKKKTASSEKSSSSKIPKTKSKASKPPPPPVRTPTPPPAMDYEDDFEEYEDDFEDYSESVAVEAPKIKKEKEVDEFEVISSPIPTPRQAVKAKAPKEAPGLSAEAEESLILRRVTQSQRSNATPSPISQFGQPFQGSRPVTSASRTFRFDNKAAVNTEAALEGAAKFQELKSALAHEFISSVDVFPNRRADIYSHIMADGNKQQRYTETNEDNLFNWTQTTPREVAENGSQCPEDERANGRSGAKAESKQNRAAETERFLQFVEIAGQVCTSLLGTQSNAEEYYFPMRSAYQFSSGFVQLIPPTRSKIQSVTAISIKRATPLVLVSYFVKETDDGQFVNETAIVVYELAEEPRVKQVLLTGDEITDFCCSLSGKDVVFGGMRNGSCILWDLTESPAPSDRSLSPTWLQVPKHTPLLHAAYSTAYSCVEKKGAGFKTNLDVQIVQVGTLRTEAVGDQQQFASLSAGGTVTIWAVGRERHSATIFDSDLGMRPNASVRLTKISVVLCSALSGFGTGAQTALNMHVNAADSRDLLVGMQQGGIIRIARGVEGLRHYFLNSGSFEFNNHVSVTAIHSSPFESEYFVAGTSTGLVLVYNVRQNIPLSMRGFQLTQQTKITAVTQIAWSPSHAQMVYVIYDRRFLAVWNLAARIEPTLIDLFDEAKSPVQRAFCWQDARKILLITLVLESGDVMVHQLERLHESNVFLRDVFAQAA